MSTHAYNRTKPAHPSRGIFGWLAIVLFAAAVGGLATTDARGFYGELNLPAWAPPGWLFGPVWSVLYLMMGASAWMVWRRIGWSIAFGALPLFATQLIANAAWSWLFFRYHQGGLAFAEILVLWALILATIVSFWRIRRAAALLLLPYLTWVTFACVLTFSVWQRNSDVLG